MVFKPESMSNLTPMECHVRSVKGILLLALTFVELGGRVEDGVEHFEVRFALVVSLGLGLGLGGDLAPWLGISMLMTSTGMNGDSSFSS